MDQSKETSSKGKKRKLPTEDCRLGPIYATDALSFLTHHWLQRCRLVSRHYSGTIDEGRAIGRLRPRENFDLFTLVEKARSNPDDYDTHGIGIDHPCGYRDWCSVAEYRHCCGEWLSTNAPPLAGQLIYPGARPTSRISFSFERTRYKEKQGVRLALRNQLTAVSAATLLHFIRHTEELYFDRVILPDRDQLERFGSFNPAVLSAVPGNQWRGWIRALEADRRIVTAFFESRRFADALKGTVVFGGHPGCVGLRSEFTPASADNASYFITQGGGCVVGEVSIGFQFAVSYFQEAMGFFERLVQRLSELEDSRTVVRRVRMNVSYHGYRASNELNAVAPLLELLSTAWSTRPEVTQNGKWDRTEYQYRYSRLVGRSAERRQRVEVVVETTRRDHEKADGTRNEVEVVDSVEIIVY